MAWIIDWLVSWWQSRCKHEDARADLLEGAALPQPGYEVQWCARCGAVQLVSVVEPGRHPRVPLGWRSPKPLWCEPHNSRAMARDRTRDRAEGK